MDSTDRREFGAEARSLKLAMLLVRNLTSYKIPRSFLVNARKLFLLLKIPRKVEVSVVFVTSAFMRNLNRRYRKKDRPTNVLSFGSSPRERRSILRSGRGMLGEIFISPAIAKAEAREFGMRFNQQLTRLLVHGILHIKGHSHATEKRTRAMERMEKKIMARLR